MEFEEFRTQLFATLDKIVRSPTYNQRAREKHFSDTGIDMAEDATLEAYEVLISEKKRITSKDIVKYATAYAYLSERVEDLRDKEGMVSDVAKRVVRAEISSGMHLTSYAKILKD